MSTAETVVRGGGLLCVQGAVYTGYTGLYTTTIHRWEAP